MVAVTAAVLLATLAVGGCGGDKRAATLRRGRRIFVASCAGCHTVAGRESGAVGGDLVKAHLDVADLASFAEVMPTPTPLSQADATAVARYIDSVSSPAKPHSSPP